MPEPTEQPAVAATSIAELAGLVKDVSVKIEEGDQRVTASLKDIKDKQKSTEEWCKEIERTIEKAKSTHQATGGTDAIRASIPQRHERALELQARFATRLVRRGGESEYDCVVRTTALESWLKNQLLLYNPQVANRIGAKLMEENDKIARSFGFGVTKDLQEDGGLTEGGATVPVPVEAEVLRIEQDASTVLPLCRQVPMITKTHLFPSLTSGVTVAIIAEEATITESDPVFAQLALTAKKIAVRCQASMELIQDSGIGMISFVTTLMAEARGLFLDKQILEGDGTGVNFTGLVAAAGVNEVTNGTNGLAPTFAKVIEQKWKGRKRSSRRGTSWVAAPEIGQKIEALVDSQGQPIFKLPIAGNATSLGGGGSVPDGMLQGFPFYSHDQIAINRTVGSSTDCSNMYYGPFDRGVIVGRLLGMQFGVSEHVAWATGQLDVRMISRDAVLIGVPAYMTKQTGLRTA
jgi:HK97 family phage major capsid protein